MHVYQCDFQRRRGFVPIDIHIRHDLVDKAGDVNPIIADTTQEIPDNYVTKYDIAGYNSILKTGFSIIEIATANGAQDQKGLAIQPSRFSHRGGQATSDGILFSLKDVSSHFVYGPYIELPEGWYRIEFDVQMTDATPPGLMTFDVAQNGKTLARYNSFRTDIHNSVFPILEFYLRKPALVEFRIDCRRWASGTVLFKGVRLFKLADMSALSQNKNVRRRLANFFAKLSTMLLKTVLRTRGAISRSAASEKADLLSRSG